jgi:hypothetical protein
MEPYYTHGSSRAMTPERCAKLCELLAESHTLEEASEAIGVSIRTVQRERKRDEDFDHEVLLALQKTPDPLQLMEQAARKHWRAAAWLLERRNPEEYARKPVNTTSAKKLASALRFVQEMALEAVAGGVSPDALQACPGGDRRGVPPLLPDDGEVGDAQVPQVAD